MPLRQRERQPQHGCSVPTAGPSAGERKLGPALITHIPMDPWRGLEWYSLQQSLQDLGLIPSTRAGWGRIWFHSFRCPSLGPDPRAPE